MLSAAIIDYLRKQELEKYRAFNSERYELRASINGQDNGYEPISEAALKAARKEAVNSWR